MKIWKLIIITIFLFVSLNLFARSTRSCSAKYKTNYYSWSNTYHVNVQFANGSELNSSTYSFDYNTNSTYAIIPWDNGGTTVIKTDLIYGLNSYTTSCNGKDQEGTYWSLDWSNSSYGSRNPYLDILKQQNEELLEQQRQLLKMQMLIAALPTNIYYENNTNKTIWTAICYYDVNNVWQTEGWWELSPGEKNLVAKTQNRYFYIYAYSSDKTKVWEGNDFYDQINTSKKRCGFKKCDTGGVTKNFIQKFTNK